MKTATAIISIAMAGRLFADITFQDDTFADSEWDLTPFIYGNGNGSTTATQEPAGGIPGSYRSVTIQVGPGHSTLFGFHRKTNAIYRPQVHGAIECIDYAEDSKYLSGPGGDGQASGAALRQDGRVYLGRLERVLITPETEWTPKTLNRLTARDFVLIDAALPALFDFEQHPDFSVAGAPIEFGFFRGNSTEGGSYTTVVGMDNWRVTVRTNCIVATIRVSEVEICWGSYSNWCYKVQYRPALNPSAPWATLVDCIPGNGTTNCVYDRIPAGRPHRFYQVVGTNGVPTNCLPKL